MELRDIETILAEELHFGRTARRLRISQGRVSQVIRALERNVGGALFDRNSRAVRLTTLGEEFRQGAERGHRVLTTTLAACKAKARGVVGPVRIGYLPSIGLDFIAGLIKAVESAYPECELLFRAISLHAQPETLFTDRAWEDISDWPYWRMGLVHLEDDRWWVFGGHLTAEQINERLVQHHWPRRVDPGSISYWWVLFDQHVLGQCHHCDMDHSHV